MNFVFDTDVVSTFGKLRRLEYLLTGLMGEPEFQLKDLFTKGPLLEPPGCEKGKGCGERSRSRWS